MIDDDLIKTDCLRWNQVETQDHTVKYGETMELRKDFIEELLIKLVKENCNEVSEDAIIAFGEDVL